MLLNIQIELSYKYIQKDLLPPLRPLIDKTKRYSK